MKIKYKTNFAGYICILRNIQLLLTDPTFSFTLLGSYICFVMQADFGRKNTNYGVIIRDDYELAREWHLSPATVNRNRRALIKKGLLKEVGGLTVITNFSMFEAETVKNCAGLPALLLQQFYTKSIDEVAIIMENIAKMEPTQLQNDLLNLDIPYKGKSKDISDKIDKDNN